MHQLHLECAPETLHRRVIVAVALATHGRDQTELPQLFLIVLRAILGPAIRVMQKPRSRALGREGLPERLRHQVRRHPSIHRMTDHLAGEQIFDAGKIQPAFRCRHVRNIGHPGLVRSCRDKRLGQDILRHRQGMIGLGGRRESPNLCAAKSQLLAQPRDASDPSGGTRRPAIPPGGAPVRRSVKSARVPPGSPLPAAHAPGRVSRGGGYARYGTRFGTPPAPDTTRPMDTGGAASSSVRTGQLRLPNVRGGFF